MGNDPAAATEASAAAAQMPGEAPAPRILTKGQRCVVKIDDVAFGGEGVGRVDGFVVFVPFVLTGEVVELELTEVKKSFARAKLLRVMEPSPERVEARCQHFGACGGCQYQHVAYEAQLRIKGKQAADLFQRIGGFDPGIVEPVLPCPQPFGYRNRIMIRSQWNKPEQRLNIGFVRWDCGLVEDVKRCEIAEPALNEQIQQVWAHPPPKGGLKVVLRIPPEGWQVPPDSFFQNNFFLLPKLVEVVGDRLKASGARHLVDVYCGVGFFAIELAKQVEAFAGVEYDRLAIDAARRNAAARGATNGKFSSGRAEDVLPLLLNEFSAEATAVLVDPPRKGCAPSILNLLREVQPAQVLYVSCHPATMARDLNVLCRDGVFELVTVAPLDMFPQTQHIECVADLRRREKRAALRDGSPSLPSA